MNIAKDIPAENWWIVRESTVVAEFEIQDFEELWNLQMNKDLKGFIHTMSK